MIMNIMGPTCSGKTDMAIHLSEKFPAHLISVDSALIYRHMDIGTAKPDIKQHPHALVDIIDPDQSYSVAQFLNDVKREVEWAWSHGKLPILVGGTMMYYNALINGLSEIPESDPQIREHLAQLQVDKGTVFLHQRLKTIDPLLFERLNPNDTQRVMRALEVYETSGTPLSEWQQKKGIPVFQEEQFLNVLLIPVDRKQLHANISKRFTQMLSHGFIDEVKSLMEQFDLSEDLPSMRSVGYRQALLYLKGEMDLNQMTEKSIAATRQLAKRQLTWLRSWRSGICFDIATDYQNVLSTLVAEMVEG